MISKKTIREIFTNRLTWFFVTISAIMVTGKLMGWLDVSWPVATVTVWVPIAFVLTILMGIGGGILLLKLIVDAINWNEKRGNQANLTYNKFKGKYSPEDLKVRREAEMLLYGKENLDVEQVDFEPKNGIYPHMRKTNPISFEESRAFYNAKHTDSKIGIDNFNNRKRCQPRNKYPE